MNTDDSGSPAAVTTAWIGRLFGAIDARDAGLFAGFLTEDARFRFGSGPVVSGRPAVQIAVAAFFEAIGGCRHRLVRFWQDGANVAIQGEVTYTRLDGGRVTVPFANVFRMRGEQVAEYLIYIDNAPLFAAPGS